ncbi:MAG: YcgN family cysteine cluster protein [Halocynthiibacter sp.]
MKEPIKRHGLGPKFWERPIASLNPKEWEALCDGCGKCCLNKLEDADTGDVYFTRIACRLLNPDTGRCEHYENRKQIVPECLVLTPETLPKIAYFMPASCAYRRRFENKPIPDWHPLLTKNEDSVEDAGHSVKGWTVSEFDIPEDEWENHLIEEEL